MRLRVINSVKLACTAFSIQVAFGADKLLVKYFPGEALHFFSAMAVAAKRFGTHHDQAVLHGLIGMAVTHGQGWHGNCACCPLQYLDISPS